MRAAVLHEYGAAPRPGEFAEPTAASGQVVVEVAAAALHHLDVHKATGTFYTGPPPLPSVVGTDGAGRVGGRRVYFDETVPPHGSMAEKAVVAEDALFDVPDGINDATAAACGNTGLGAWLALAWRSGLQSGETVLVLGASGAVGRIAVQAAKLLGAGRVVAAARSQEALERALERGADATVQLDGPGDLTDQIREAAGGAVDVTIDTLWGEPALAAIAAAGRRARHVEVGQVAGVDLTLPAPAIRSISLDLRGFSVAHPPRDVLREGYRRLTGHVERGDIVVDLERVPLERIEAAWERQRRSAGGAKQVVIPSPERSPPT